MFMRLAEIMLPSSFVDAEFFKFPQHQTAALSILQYMERHGQLLLRFQNVLLLSHHADHLINGFAFFL